MEWHFKHCIIQEKGGKLTNFRLVTYLCENLRVIIKSRETVYETSKSEQGKDELKFYWLGTVAHACNPNTLEG